MRLETGNAIILAPSPKGAKPLERLIGYIHEELDKVGQAAIWFRWCQTRPQRIKTAHLMAAADVLIATGSQNNVKSAYASGTPAIGVGMGNVVTIIDEGVDVDEAAKIAASKHLIMPQAAHQRMRSLRLMPLMMRCWPP